MENSLFDKLFRDDSGNIVISQMPNPPLITWAASSLLQLLFTSGKINLGLELIAFGALFTWAWEELLQGVNYFRRGLGAIVLFSLIYLKTRTY